MLEHKWINRVAIVDLVGDADIYFFDWNNLKPEQQNDFINNHLLAINERFSKKDKSWVKTWKPFALLGHSIPGEILSNLDLSAPHEGTFLTNTETDGIFYCASESSDKLALIYPEIAMLEIRENGLGDREFSAESTDFSTKVDRSESEGFTMSQIEMLMKLAGLGQVQLI